MASPPSAPSAGATARRGGLAFGIDVGSSSTKVVAVGCERGVVTEHRVLASPTPTGPGELLRLIADALGVLVAEFGQPAAVGVASMAESGVALDESGTPLTDIVRWDGSASATALARAVADDDPRRLHAATGIAASAKVPLVIWAQLRMRHPSVWRCLHRWLGMADLVVHAITGEAVTDPTLALRTMAVRRPERLSTRLAFDPVLLARGGLDASQLPDIVPHADWGRRALSSTGFGGLAAGIPVVVAGHDHVVGAWAVGACSPGSEVDSVGTSEAIVRLFAGSSVPVTAYDEGMSVGVDVTATSSTLIAGSAAAGRVIRSWTELGGGPAASGEAGAGRAAAGSVARSGDDALLPARTVVLPYPLGRQSPRPDADARLSVAGADAASLAPARIRALTPALLDGLALHARWMRDTQTAVLGAAPTGGMIVVGRALGADDPWLRRKAAAFGEPVRVPAVAEPVACGAAMLAVARTAGYDPPALPLRHPIVPSAASVAAYADAFPRFLAHALERTP